MIKHYVLISTILSIVSCDCIKNYTIQWTDTCNSIVKKNNISFPTFIALNRPINCLSLQHGKSLCLAKANFTEFPIVECLTKYRITSVDTCDSISISRNVPLLSILNYNPGLDCTQLQLGQLICLDNKTQPYCNRSHIVAPGDSCQSIADKNQISFNSLIALNKPIDCASLEHGQYLCLAKDGFNSFPILKCKTKYRVHDDDSCESIVENFNIDLTTLLAYNPGLDCQALQIKQVLCLDNSALMNAIDMRCTNKTMIKTGDTCNSIVARNKIKNTAEILNFLTIYNPSLNCNNVIAGQILCLDSIKPPACLKAYSVITNQTCASLANLTGVSVFTILRINPHLDCTNIVNQVICLSRMDVQNYISNSCPESRYIVKEEETCESIINARNITKSVFEFYNPGIDCSRTLAEGLEVCLGLFLNSLNYEHLISFLGIN